MKINSRNLKTAVRKAIDDMTTNIRAYQTFTDLGTPDYCFKRVVENYSKWAITKNLKDRGAIVLETIFLLAMVYCYENAGTEQKRTRSENSGGVDKVPEST